MKIEILPIGTTVTDDLTGQTHKVIGVSVQLGRVNDRTYSDFPVVGYWIDSDWLGGGRHPWELTHPLLDKYYAD